MRTRSDHDRTTPQWLDGNAKAIAIVRVSSKKQLGNNSPGVQRNGTTTYAAERGLDLVRVEEFHESAKRSRDRRKFHALLERAREEGIRHLIFWVWDRTTRNATDAEAMEEDVRDDIFVVHIAHEWKVLHKDTPESEWGMADFSTLAAKQYSRDLSRRAKEGHVARAEKGWYPTRAPLGYRNQKRIGEDGQVKDRGGTIELTEWGRRLVRRMAELRLKGHALDAIASIVIEEDLVPRKNQRRFRGAGRKSGVERVLKDVFYRGDFVWSGKLYRGKHEAVFTPEEWNAIQE